MPAQKIFVETSVALKVGTTHLPEHEWQAALRCLTTDFEFVVSPLSFFEVLKRLAGGQEEYILRNTRALRALSPTNPQAPTFLEMPGQFALHEILRCGPVADTFQPWHLEEATRIILDHHELTPELRAWLADVWQMHASGETDYINKLREMQRAGRMELDRALWLHEIFRPLGIISLSQDETEKSSQGLDAACRYTEYVLGQLRNPEYSPRGSNWVDFQQLFYLCDPNIYILYLDRHFETRTGATSQRSQLVNIRKLLESSQTDFATAI